MLWRKYLLPFVFIVGFILTLAAIHPFSLEHFGFSDRAIAQSAPWEDTKRYPRRAESSLALTEDQGAAVPDWSQVTFSDLLPIAESGSFSVPPEVIEKLGYDPSFVWEAGQTIDQFLKLGNLEDSNLRYFTWEEIAYSAGLDLGSLTLADFEPLQWQTLEDVVLAIPELQELKISEVQPIFDRLLQENSSYSVWSEKLLGEVIGDSEIASLILGDLDLSSYGVDTIPFLSSTRIENFSNWQNALISKITGLQSVPWSEFIENIPTGVGIVALFDVAYGKKEARRVNTITGSDVEGFNVPCRKQSCSHIELSGPPNLLAQALHGKQWIKGGNEADAQMVRGGHGLLKVVNGGKEPTGRHPFGSSFKVVLRNTIESEGVGEFAVYFRYCSGYLGCTPYFIGPVPWITQHENDIIFVGLTVTTAPPPNIPKNPGLPPGFELPPGEVDPNNPQIPIDDCQTYKGVSMGALRQAITTIESYGGDYTAIGQYVCADKGRNCGRALGKYQFMPYNEHAKSRILRRSGGAEFLNRASSLDTSPVALQSEILKYFPPEDQEAAYSAWIKELIDRARAEGLTGDALIARVGEMHNAGKGGRSPRYGKRTANEYKKSLPAVEEKCNKQGSCTGKLIDPAPGYPLTSFFGWRRHPITGKPRFHSGIDIGTPIGTPIKAADGGTVTHSGDMGGYGFTIDINHCDIRSTRYAHNSELLVGRGTGINQGQVISKAGSTGNSTGPHLHFEVRIKGNAVDPRTYLRGR